MNIVHLSYADQHNDSDFPVYGQALAIGYFDGVHLGHQEVIQRTLHIAKRLQVAASIMTFHPHPKEVLGQVTDAGYLTPLEEKLQLFTRMGLDYTYIVSFDERFSQLSPQQFASNMLVAMKVKTAVVGFDFTFGYLGKGTAESLRRLSGDQIEVEVVQPHYWDGHKVSSTLIREQMQQGNLACANQMLGREYIITGVVVSGEGRGRTIGFPTANIAVSAPYVIPRTGVYAVRVVIDGVRFGGVMNIGYKPTFHENEITQTIEVHLFDFDRYIYHKQVEIEFITFIRQEAKFASVEKLVAQIQQDCDQAKVAISQIQYNS